MLFAFLDELLVAEEFNIFIRLFISILLGAGVGVCKEYLVRPAGFRASVLISIASALITLVGVYGISEALSTIIGATIVMSGLVTLGIINNNREQHNGVVNACLIIVCTVIGITCATGMFFAAVCTTLLAVLSMFVLKIVEKSMMTKGYVLNIIINSRVPVLKELLYIFENNHLITSSLESKIVLFEREECVKIRVEFVSGTSKVDVERAIPIIKEKINPLSISMRNDTYGVIK